MGVWLRWFLDASKTLEPKSRLSWGKVLWHVLELACQSGVLDEVQQPEGTVQILLSTVPSSNSIALLLQFMAKFPKIRVDFVEAWRRKHHGTTFGDPEKKER